MYWFAPPPWVRWLLSVILLAAAFAVEVTDPPTDPRWFAVTEISAGQELQPSMFRQIQVPVGLLPLVEPTGFAETDMLPGDPLTTGHVSSSDVEVPGDWWIVELPVPSQLHAGQDVLLVILEGERSTTVNGVTVAVATDTDPFVGGSTRGSIAVPGNYAAAVAVASATGNVTVLVGSN